MLSRFRVSLGSALWGGFGVLCLGGLAVNGVHYLNLSAPAREAALEQSQKIIIHVADHAIEGKLFTPAEEKTAENAPKEAEDTEKTPSTAPPDDAAANAPDHNTAPHEAASAATAAAAATPPSPAGDTASHPPAPAAAPETPEPAPPPAPDSASATAPTPAPAATASSALDAAPPAIAVPVALPRTKASLAAAPIAEITERTEQGDLPVKSKDGATIFKLYARPASGSGSHRIALIVTGLGVNRDVTQSALNLPEDVSLAFSPYGKFTSLFAANARTLGHETVLELPVQPSDYPVTDPGPLGLLAGNEEAENLSRMHRTLARLPGFVGVIVTDTPPLADAALWLAPLFKDLGARGVAVFFPPGTALPKELQILKLASHTADAFIDAPLDAEAARQELGKILAAAKKNDSTLVYIRAYPVMVRALAEWLGGLEKEGITLAPASSLLAP